MENILEKLIEYRPLVWIMFFYLSVHLMEASNEFLLGVSSTILVIFISEIIFKLIIKLLTQIRKKGEWIMNKKEYIILGLIFMLGIILGSLVSFNYLNFITSNENQVICYDFKELNETINKIGENCGSTFLSHTWNDTSNWYVFKTTYENNQPNYNYYPLEDCLK